MKKLFEVSRILAGPFLPAVQNISNRYLRYLTKGAKPNTLEILDVGGRLSPYTVGIDQKITIIDLPKESRKHEEFNLGIGENEKTALKAKRSNIKELILEDFLGHDFPDNSFDGIVSVEVIEHIKEYDRFVSKIADILKPGGRVLIVTQNGDYIKKETDLQKTDHVRHYTKKMLAELLNKYFIDVDIKYGVRTGRYRMLGIKSMNIKHPVRTFVVMFGNLVSNIQSLQLSENSGLRYAHLFAIAKKKG